MGEQRGDRPPTPGRGPFGWLAGVARRAGLMALRPEDWEAPRPPARPRVVGCFAHEGFRFRLLDDPAADPALGEGLAELFTCLRVEEGQAAGARDLCLVERARRGQRRVWALLDGQVVAADEDPALVVEELVMGLDRWVLDASPADLHLHAGLVVGERGDGVLVVGGSGAGKSSLVATLTRAGYRYVTDEMVTIPRRGGPVDGLRRPLVLKSGSWARFHELSGAVDALPWRPAWAWHVPPPALAGGVCPDPVEVRLVALCARQHEPTPARLVTRSRADTVVDLLEHCYDAVRFDGTLDALAGLVAGATCVRAEYTEADELVPQVADALAAAPPALPVRDPGPTGPRTPRRAPTTRSRVIGDVEAVVEDLRTGGMTSLAGPGATLWYLLDGSVGLDGLVRELAGEVEHPDLVDSRVREVLDRLAALGLVEGWDPDR